MKVSRTEIIERLKSTSVHDLAVEIATETAKDYPSHLVKMEESIAKFERMLAPLAPKTVTVEELMAGLNVEVVRVA